MIQSVDVELLRKQALGRVQEIASRLGPRSRPQPRGTSHFRRARY